MTQRNQQSGFESENAVKNALDKTRAIADNQLVLYKIYCILNKDEKSVMRTTEVRESTAQAAIRKAEEYFYRLAKKYGGNFKIVMYTNN